MTKPKNLSELLAPYPFFFQASESDNRDILEFFNSITMDTKSMSLRYDRGSDFFQFTKEQSSNSLIFIIRDDKKIIKGTASISFIPHFYQGKMEIFGYLGDLRISPTLSAKIRIHWKKCYSEIIENFQNLEEFRGVRYLYTAILDDNQSAMRSLLKNNDQLIYHHLTNYQTFNVLQMKFFESFRKNKYLTEKTSLENISPFLYEQASGAGLKPYYCDNNDSEILRHLTSWQGFNKDSFCVVLEPNTKKVLATYAPWICQSKKLVIEKMNFRQKILSFFSPLLGIPSLKNKNAINLMYLTHLHFRDELTPKEREIILCDILKTLLRQKNRSFHAISFFVFPEWEINHLPYIIEKTKAQFFQVMNKDQFNASDFINLENTPPAFEIGIA